MMTFVAKSCAGQNQHRWYYAGPTGEETISEHVPAREKFLT